jgi:hypothetical protein
MIEQDPITRIHPIRLAIIHHDPIRIKLRATIGTAWVEWRRFALWCFHDFAIQFGCGGLVEPDMLFKPASANGIEETEGAESVNVTSVFGHFERDFDV